jgi:amidase
VLALVRCERPWLVDDDISNSRIEEIATATRMVVSINVLGLPSCAVPVATTAYPRACSSPAARFREDILLDAAQAIEDRPPVLTPIEPRLAVGA